MTVSKNQLTYNFAKSHKHLEIPWNGILSFKL
jgi:hypothetical protein